MSDKVRELAEKLVSGFLGDARYMAANPKEQPLADSATSFLKFIEARTFERILREELEPLLDAAHKVVDDYANRSQWQGVHPQTRELAAELQGWKRP